ncbi:MAG: hypothetical protein EOO77_14190 [Oxalobacteraceae bacterium]|nr:MAG: hypothetical protein EOO77_14190 [Oxalobacteraceae bacterium]
MTSPNQISTSPLPTIAQEDTPISPIIDPSFVSSSMSNSNSNAISPEEAARLRNEVMTLQAQLDQAEEAREASEQCLKALREFIATSPGGGGTDSFDGQMNLTSADLVGIRLPPLPTDKDPDEPPTPPAKEEKRPAMTGWGSSLGKLWKGQGGAAPPSVMSPHSTVVEPSTPGLLSPGQSVRSLPQRSNSPTSAMSQLPSAQEPIEDKLNAIPTSNMPLANFVASWTKTVAPGTPAATPLSGSTSGSGESRPSAARAFSGLWGRKKDDKEKPAEGEIPDVPQPTEAEIDFLLDTVNQALERPLTRDDIAGTYAGLRPLLDSDGSTADLSRKHAVLTSTSGVVTVVGGKLTTYRQMAEDAVDAVALTTTACRTRNLPLLGAASRDELARLPQPERLVRRFGTEAALVLANAVAVTGLSEAELTAPGPAGVTLAELVFGVTHEGAVTVEDLLDRRTRVGLVTADRAAAVSLAERALELAAPH